jgi:hypothetical protein
MKGKFKGFARIDVLITLVIIGLIAEAGIFIYHMNTVNNISSTTMSTGGFDSNSGAMVGVVLVPLIISLVIAILLIAAMWKVNTKAGQPGWATIVPIYNVVVLCRIAGKPGWWVVLTFIPVVNFVILIILYNGISSSFGHGLGFTAGLLLLPFIFFPILAFGNSQYVGFAQNNYTG